jgi:hypothetical protein
MNLLSYKTTSQSSLQKTERGGDHVLPELKRIVAVI